MLSSSSLSSGSMTRRNRTGDRSLEYASLDSECGGQLAINLHFALGMVVPGFDQSPRSSIDASVVIDALGEWVLHRVKGLLKVMKT